MSLQNLFGTPAQNRRVTARLTLSPAFPAFRAYPDFQFFDPQAAREGFAEPLADATTDEQGERLLVSTCSALRARPIARTLQPKVSKRTAGAA